MFPPGTLEAFGLYLVRTGALVLASPLIGTGATFSGYKVGLIGVLALLLFSVAGAPAVAAGGPLEYGVLALREVLIGLSLAFVLHAVTLAVRVGSELVGHEMAFTMSRVVDPESGTNVPLVSHMYEMLFFLALLAVNGHHWIVRALAESYERAPVGSLSLSGDLPAIALDQFAQLFAAGITFAAPILAFLMMVSVVIGLLARAVPQINVLEFGFNLRIAGGLVAMLVFAPVLTPALERLLHHLMGGLETTLDAMGV